MERGSGLASFGCDDNHGLERISFGPQDREAAKREALVRRLESALAGPDGQHSAQYSGTAVLKPIRPQ